MENRWGKLPVTVYGENYTAELDAAGAGISDYSLSRPPGRSYRYYTGEPLFPFGHGLSYTSFAHACDAPAADADGAKYFYVDGVLIATPAGAITALGYVFLVAEFRTVHAGIDALASFDIKEAAAAGGKGEEHSQLEADIASWFDPAVEEYVAEKLGLMAEPVSTQVIPRDRHAMFFAVLGVIASSVERLATEIRHLQRTEVREAEEFFSKGQKGSSAMPHKRNPVLTENLTGLARIVRSAVVPAMENVALWHERDISHSSVERMIAPDATVTLDFALFRLAGVVENLLVYPEALQENLDQLGGLIFSQRVLLALTQAGVSREESYRLVQRNAMKVWEEGADFLTELKNDGDVTAHVNGTALTDLFDMSYHTKNVEIIFRRVFGA